MMYNSYIMKRTQIYVDEEQDKRLAKRAKAEGVTKSTLIRRAVDAYLDTPDNDAVALAKFRAALERFSRGKPLDLPDGKTYVEQLRANDRRRQEELERQWRR